MKVNGITNIYVIYRSELKNKLTNNRDLLVFNLDAYYVKKTNLY